MMLKQSRLKTGKYITMVRDVRFMDSRSKRVSGAF